VPVRLALITALLLGLTSPQEHWWLERYQAQLLPASGQGVTVAVIDTGVDDSHPDLVGAVVSGRDFSGVGAPDGSAPVGPFGYHGTMVASLIVGQGSEAVGVIGLAPGAKVMPLSIGLGVAGADTDQQIADAVVWAADNGADVINLSLTRNSKTWPKSWDSAFSYALSKDVVIVAAAGNRSTGAKNPSAPGTMPGILAVGGIGASGEVATLASVGGIAVDLVAPAEQMLGAFPGSQLRVWEGSSAAAPLVSALAALIRSSDPEATANDVLARILNTAVDLGPRGFDADFGFGEIDPAAALASTLSAEVNPLGNLETWIRLYRPSQREQQGELSEPEQPELTAEYQIVQANPLIQPDGRSSWWLNPLLYWVLSPLAPLLWLVLRRRRKKALAAKTQEGNS
jgi:subtilisin family serine protease